MKSDVRSANRRSRERLVHLTGRLSDADLARPAVAGWTIAATLAHIAFYDFRALHLLRRWKEGGLDPSPFDAEAINESQKPILLRLPVRTAAELAVQAAEAIDLEIEAAPQDLVERIRTSGAAFRFERCEHRDYHLDEIEKLLEASGG